MEEDISLLLDSACLVVLQPDEFSAMPTDFFVVQVIAIVCVAVDSLPQETSDEILTTRLDRIGVNVTQALVPNGKTFVVRCPQNGNPRFKAIYLFGATYVLEPTGKGNTKTNNNCQDLHMGESFEDACNEKPTCSIEAKDPSNVAGCKKRPLRVRFTCQDPSK